MSNYDKEVLKRINDIEHLPNEDKQHIFYLIDNLVKAVFGSLIVTNKATFFISIGLGKINIKSNDFFIISLYSPIGMIIKNKTINKSFQFRGVDYKIKNIE